MILVSTTNVVDGENKENLGAVITVAVRSNSQIGNFVAKLKAMAGGRLAMYEKIVLETENDAMEKLKAAAAGIGGTEVCSLRLAVSSIRVGAQEDFIQVTAYGTAFRGKS